MKPQQEVPTGYQGDFFRTELSRMVNTTPKGPDGKSGRWDGLGSVLNGSGTNLASEVGTPRSKHTIDGVVTVSQVRL
jgi:hypothetical protein